MRTGIPTIHLATPATAGLGSRGVPGDRHGWSGGSHVGADTAPAVRAAALLPRPGVSSSTPAAACCTAAPQTALAPGGGPPALSATPVSAVQRSD